MEPLTTIIILSFTCFITLSTAIYFCIRKIQLQRRINAIKKITEDFKRDLQSPSSTKSNDQFYSLIEPVLQHAGYTFRFLSEGQFLVHNGDIHFTIKQLPAPKCSTYKRVLLESRFKDDRAKVLFEEEGILLITNRLSGIYPEFNVVCSNDGRVRIRYSCDINKPSDLLPHIAYACDFFEKIQTEAEQAITDMYALFQNKNNNKTK